jgi:hypothetical protein
MKFLLPLACNLNLSDLATGLSAFLTPAIGVVTVVIVVFQYRLARQRWVLDLFDKRYPVFLRTVEYLTAATGSLTHECLFQFVRETKDNEFLFKGEVHDFLDLIYRKGVELMTTQTLLSGPPPPNDQELEKLAQKEADLKLWFGEQFETARRVFRPYLNLDKK